MKYIKVFSILFCLFFVGNSKLLKAELILRLGYLNQSFSNKKGYNKFLKERYGYENKIIEGTIYSVGFKGIDQNWGVGMETGEINGDIKYKTLNNAPQTNRFSLENTLVILSIFFGKSGSFELDFGYGTNKFIRDFYGYNSTTIVTSNVANQEGTKKSTTDGQIQMLQILYNIIGNFVKIEVGGRHIISEHVIRSTDNRPGYNSHGVPKDLIVDLGGTAFISYITFLF